MTKSSFPVALCSRRLFLWAILALVLLCLPALAHAGTYQSDLFVQLVLPESREGEAAQSRVLAYRDSKRTSLFLPSGWDRFYLSLHYPDTRTLYLNGNPFPSGSTLPSIETGSQITLTTDTGIVKYRLNVMLGTGIPSVFIQTDDPNIKRLNYSKDNRDTGALLLYGANGMLQNNGRLSEIRGRGNSTFHINFRKRAYQIRLDQGADLCGMGKARTYNLMADYIDISLLRNRISMDIAKQIGIPCALDSQSVNLYLNNCYNGVYLLAEKVTVNPNRVDIYDLEKATEAVNGGSLEGYAKSRVIKPDSSWIVSYDIPNNPADITGGYILELDYFDRFTRARSGVRTSNGASFEIKEPTYVTFEQAEFICEILSRYHRAILSKDGVDPKSGMRYDELVDTDSMALVLIMQEFCKNYDNEASSMFFFKDADAVSTKVYAGPVWDFDRAYGSVETGYWLNSPHNMLYQTHNNKEKHYIYGNVFNNQADFNARVKELYAERYLPALALLLGERERQEGDALRSLADYREEIEPSVRMNFTYWNSFTIKQIAKYSGQTFDASYAYLEKFIIERRDTLIKNWLK